jgi:hypothetical protein
MIYLTLIKKNARGCINCGGEGMVVQLLNENGLLFQNRLYVMKFKSLTPTIALRFNINDDSKKE